MHIRPRQLFALGVFLYGPTTCPLATHDRENAKVKCDRVVETASYTEYKLF